MRRQGSPLPTRLAECHHLIDFVDNGIWHPCPLHDLLELHRIGVIVPLTETPSGHYQIDLCDLEKNAKDKLQTKEVDVLSMQWHVTDEIAEVKEVMTEEPPQSTPFQEGRAQNLRPM